MPSPPPLDPARAPWNVAAPAPRQDAALLALMERVARTRELERGDPPTLARVPREWLVERALALNEARSAPGSLDAEARWLWALELVPRDFRWQAALRRAFEARLSAFYDAERAEIVIDAALAGNARQRVLAHELVHALVDRHFGLAARLADTRATSDARAALHLLAEGDADAVVLELWPEDDGGPLPAAGAGSLDTAESELPPVLQRSIAATYADGARVVRGLRARTGWRAIDALYRDPPGSTRALLSPEQAPSTPSWPRGDREPLGPSPGSRLAYSDVLGEQALRIVLEEWLPAARAAELASDWEGDALSVFEGAGAEPERALMWEIRWRDGRGESGAAALRRGLRLPPSAPTRGNGSLVCRAHRDAGVVGLWSHGDRAWLGHLIGVPTRSGCEQLERWARAAEESPPERRDPGPRRLIGPA